MSRRDEFRRHQHSMGGGPKCMGGFMCKLWRKPSTNSGAHQCKASQNLKILDKFGFDVKSCYYSINLTLTLKIMQTMEANTVFRNSYKFKLFVILDIRFNVRELFVYLKKFSVFPQPNEHIDIVKCITRIFMTRT